MTEEKQKLETDNRNNEKVQNLMMMMMMMMMNCFSVWLTDERRLALFPAETIVRDPHHRSSGLAE